jgi:hypothetical protein
MRRLRILGGGRHQSASAGGTVIVRAASPGDAVALERVAGLDSVHLPGGPMLVAEVGEDLRAALCLSDGTVVADPFHRTAEVVELLRARAAELSGSAA